MKSPRLGWLRVGVLGVLGVLGVGWGEWSCRVDRGRLDVAFIIRRVIGPGDKQTVDGRAGEDRRGEKRYASAMGRTPTVDRFLFIWIVLL